MSEEKTVNNIKQLGEFSLISHLTTNFEIKNSTTRISIGDDAAVIKSDKQQVITTDTFVEGVDFDRIYMPLKHLGYKIIVGAISDVMAMNAMPQQVLVSIAVSSSYTIEAMEEIYKGIHQACENYQLDLIGGDTTTAPTGLIITVTAIGEIEEKDIVKRSGAGEKELICVTGDLGAAYMGLIILEGEKEEFLSNPMMQPDLEENAYLIERQLKPEARGDAINFFRDKEVLPTAMIDISDGLASDLMQICYASKVGAMIYEDKIPIDHQTSDAAMKYSIDPTTAAMNGGEDYELLFTLKQSDYEKVKEEKNIAVIGFIDDEKSGINLITKNGVQVAIESQGWKKSE